MKSPATDPLSDLVSTSWLAEALAGYGERGRVKVVDARWFMPGSAQTGRACYLEAHIPGAGFFDIDAVCDPVSTLPHMLPSATAFGRAMGNLGITPDCTVVVYDGASLMSAPRVWWTLRRFGHMRVAILDGGIGKWASEGRALQAGPEDVTPVPYTATPDDTLVTSLASLYRTLGSAAAQVIDARPAARFAGTQPEPRPGLRAGHIPGSINVPFQELVNSLDGRLKGETELAAVFSRAGVEIARPAIASCGSGVTACIVSFALARLGNRNVPVYDGSWAEWGRLDALPVAATHG